MKRIVSILFDDRYYIIPVNHLRLSIIENKTVNLMNQVTNNTNTFTISNFNILYPRFILNKTKTKFYDFKRVISSSNYSRTYQLNNRSIQSIQFDLLVDIDYFSIPIYKEFVLINTDLDNDKTRSYYLLDYFIPSKSLCIELDSDLHNEDKDNLKDKFLTSLGIKVLRIRDFNIDTKTKLNSILNFIQSNPYNEFEVDYSELIEEFELLSNELKTNKLKEKYGELYFIRPKWRKVIYKLDEYYKNIIPSILDDKTYQFSINLSDIFNLIPMHSKEVRIYNSLVNYLKSLDINMTIVSNSNYKGKRGTN